MVPVVITGDSLYLFRAKTRQRVSTVAFPRSRQDHSGRSKSLLGLEESIDAGVDVVRDRFHPRVPALAGGFCLYKTAG